MTGLPQGWAETTLGTLSEYITSGSRDWSCYYADQGSLFIRTQDIKTNSLDNFSNIARVALPEKVEGKRTLVLPNDILITITGANVGKVARVPDEMPEAYVSQSVALVRLCQPEQARFLQKAIMCPQDDGVTALRGAAYGQGRPVLSLDDVRDTPIPLPPLPEQRRIVRKLDTLSARSTSARAHLTAIEKLVERYKRAVAQQLIHAQEWETVPFLDACDAYQPMTISKSELVPDGAYPVYGANGVIGRYDQYNHEDPQLLITCRGATCGTVNVSHPFSWITGNAMVVDGTKSGLSLAFLREYFAKGFDFTTVISGSAQPQITRQSLAQLRMPVVNEDQQREIVRRIETAFGKIDRLAAEAARALKLLGHLDQRILAKAFAGDLVPQDPNDEPAETLLARISAARSSVAKTKRGRKNGLA